MKKDLLDLLATTDFENLNKEERAMVLHATTEENYNAERETIVTAKQVMQTEQEALTPLPFKFPTAVDKEEKVMFFGLFQHRIPTWMAAAACVLVFLLLKNSDALNSATSTSTFTSVDTVYLTQTIERTAYVKQPVNNGLQKQSAPPKSIVKKNYDTNPINTITRVAPEYNEAMFAVDQINYAQLISSLSQTTGTSAKEDTLAQLFGNSVN